MQCSLAYCTDFID